jgi:hypothetical protein
MYFTQQVFYVLGALLTYFLMTQQPLAGQGLLSIHASRSHSDTSHSVGSPGGVISPAQRPLRDNTQHSQETDMPRRNSSPLSQKASNRRALHLYTNAKQVAYSLRHRLSSGNDTVSRDRWLSAFEGNSSINLVPWRRRQQCHPIPW